MFFGLGSTIFSRADNVTSGKITFPEPNAKNKETNPLAPREKAAAKEFVERWQKQLKEKGEMSAHSPTEEEKDKRTAFNKAARKHCKEQLGRFGVNDVVGHVPDMAMGGDPEGKCDWMPLPPKVNQSFGGMANGVDDFEDDPNWEKGKGKLKCDPPV